MNSYRPHVPRKRIMIPVFVMLLLLVGALAVWAAAPPNIDTFANTQTTLAATFGSPASGTANDSGAGNILGTEREAHALVASGPNGLSLVFNGSTLSINTGDFTVATTTLTYDGTTDSDPDPASVDTNGLCAPTCPSLTQGGTNNGFRIVVPSDDTNGDLRITVWDGVTGNTCTRLFTDFFPGLFSLGPTRSFFVEYPAINSGTCTGGSVNFNQVGAVQFQISGAALDMTIDTIDIAVFDWGDLPENSGTCISSPASGYATTEACKGPRHAIPTGSLRLGGQIDPSPAPTAGEFNGQPTTGANGDNLTDSDDEQGVTTLWAGGGCLEWWCNGTNGGKIRVQVTGTGYLLGWIDFDENGFEADEVVVNQAVTTGTYDVSFNIPSGTLPTSGTKNLYARFRLFGDGELTSGICGTNSCRPYLFDGRDGFTELSPAQEALNQSKDGEVEDYLWVFNPLGVTLASFEAEARADHVLLTWETSTELNNRGFNLYRGISDAGPDRRLNQTLIPSQSPGSPGGFIYTWEDRADLQAGTTYYYWVEDIDLNGVATRHGPAIANFSSPTSVEVSVISAASASGATISVWSILLAMLLPLLGGIAAVRRRA